MNAEMTKQKIIEVTVKDNNCAYQSSVCAVVIKNEWINKYNKN